MKFNSLIFFLLFFSINSRSQENDSIEIRAIYDEVLTHSDCYQNLEYLCKKIGNRLCGSTSLDNAITWAKKTMEDEGFDSVWLQEVMVPVWKRNTIESAVITYGEEKNTDTLQLHICSLGGSIGTNGVITSQIIEVHSLKEVAELGEEKIKGKIVFYNRSFDDKLIETFHAYGGAVDQRGMGAIVGAKYGAVAVIVRSMTSLINQYPHTGVMYYNDSVKKIPSAAVSTMDANTLSVLLKMHKNISLSLQMNCENLPDKKQYNVIGQITGNKLPEKIILVGGHIDSWDKGEGAHDDGSGMVQSIEVLRIFKALGIKPNHTIRAVMFINEENGSRGGKAYAAWSKENNIEHIAAIESDRGSFTPRGFEIDAGQDTINIINNWNDLFAPYYLHIFSKGYSGVDINPMKNGKVVLMGLLTDSQRYFDYHHSDLDVFEAIDKRELELGAGAMASMVYLIDKYEFTSTTK